MSRALPPDLAVIRKIVLTFAAILIALTSSAHNADGQTPRVTIEDECTAIAYSGDGRLAYSVRHIFNLGRFQVQRDDIWILEKDGRRHKIVNGEKLVQGQTAYSYTVTKLHWSPVGAKLTAELLTSELDRTGRKQDSHLLLLLNQEGKEIRIIGGDSVLPGALDGTWLNDGITVAYYVQSVKSTVMFAVGASRPEKGRGGVLFEGRPFSAVSWNADMGLAAVIDLGPSLAGQPNLVLLDLIKEDHHPVVALDAYVGGLSFSPSGKYAAYFISIDTLEVRDVAHPSLVSRIRAPYGTIAWGPGETRVMIKPGLEKEDGDLVWVPLPSLSADSDAKPATPTIQPLLNSLSCRDFALSPDGHSVAVILPGNRNLQIFDLQENSNLEKSRDDGELEAPLPKQATVVSQDAPVHDDKQTRGSRARSSGFVNYALLHPYGTCTNTNS
jgi:hypothetical protein